MRECASHLSLVDHVEPDEGSTNPLARPDLLGQRNLQILFGDQACLKKGLA
jgi:hypothetical protein